MYYVFKVICNFYTFSFLAMFGVVGKNFTTIADIVNQNKVNIEGKYNDNNQI